MLVNMRSWPESLLSGSVNAFEGQFGLFEVWYPVGGWTLPQEVDLHFKGGF